MHALGGKCARSALHEPCTTRTRAGGTTRAQATKTCRIHSTTAAQLEHRSGGPGRDAVALQAVRGSHSHWCRHVHTAARASHLSKHRPGQPCTPERLACAATAERGVHAASVALDKRSDTRMCRDSSCFDPAEGGWHTLTAPPKRRLDAMRWYPPRLASGTTSSAIMSECPRALLSAAACRCAAASFSSTCTAPALCPTAASVAPIAGAGLRSRSPCDHTPHQQHHSGGAQA